MSCSAWASRSAAIQAGSLSRVGDHHHLRRAGHHVDADLAEHLPLGGGDIGIAGPDDLGDGSDALSAVSERGDRLRAAHAIDLAHAGELGRHQHQRIERTFRAGTTMTMRGTPATLAGTAFINTELG